MDPLAELVRQDLKAQGDRMVRLVIQVQQEEKAPMARGGLRANEELPEFRVCLELLEHLEKVERRAFLEPRVQQDHPGPLDRGVAVEDQGNPVHPVLEDILVKEEIQDQKENLEIRGETEEKEILEELVHLGLWGFPERGATQEAGVQKENREILAVVEEPGFLEKPDNRVRRALPVKKDLKE